jgi:hypothetical protein
MKLDSKKKTFFLLSLYNHTKMDVICLAYIKERMFLIVQSNLTYNKLDILNV